MRKTQSFKELLFSKSPKLIGDKALSPSETIKMAEEALSRSGFRFYRGVKRVDKGRLGIPVYMSFYDLDGQKLTGKFKQMGKGENEEFAKASAIMELIERLSVYHFLKTLPEKALFTSYDSLSFEGLPFEEIEKSLENKEDFKKFIDFFKKIPFYFVKNYCLTMDKEILFPFHWFWLIYEYNGSSSGNTYAETACQAICEIVERHNSTLYRRLEFQELKEIDCSQASSQVKNLIEKFINLGIKLWIRDLSLDFKIPTVGVMAMDPSTFPERSEIVFTAGTSLSPERALIRALTEVAQLAGDFDTEGKYEECVLPKYSSLDEAKPFITTQEKISLYELPDFSKKDHLEELLVLKELFKEKGFHIFLTDITHPELKIPAIYATSPGMLFRERTSLSHVFHLAKLIYLFYPQDLKFSLLEEMKKSFRDRYFIFAYLGNLYKEKEEFEKAEKCYKEALALCYDQEDLIAIYSNLADLYLKKGSLEKAISLCDEALKIREIPELWNLIGRAFYKGENYREAMEAFFRAIELNPASDVDYANIGFCLLKLNLLPEAELFFRKALEINPELEIAKRGLQMLPKTFFSEN